MGKQVRFYMLPEDEAMFLDFVLESGPVEIIQVRTIQRAILKLERSYLQGHDLVEPVFWNTMFPLSETYFEEVRPLEFDPVLLDYVNSGKIFYYLDKNSAPVIEFDRCKQVTEEDGDVMVLTKGRIWADMYRLENDAMVYKGEAFENWYDRVAKWIRTRFRRIRHYDGYFGPAANKYLENGGYIRQ